MEASVRPGCGPWGRPSGCRVMRAVLDALAAHELVVAVIEHLVGHHVRMIVRRRHRLRVVVVQPRHEGAEHEAVALEGLVHRRRLVQPAGDRLEVVDAEGPGVVVAVPADGVEGVMVEDHALADCPALHHDGEFPGLVVERQQGRRPDIPLAERAVLEQLAVRVAVAGGRAHVAPALDDQEDVLLAARAGSGG